MKLLKNCSSSILGASSYIISQVFNLSLQLIVIYQYGPKLYAKTGLAQLAIITLIFVGELGYSLYFLRESQTSSKWKIEWKYAQGHRALVLFLGSLVLITYWLIRYGTNDQSTFYILTAIPAIYMSLFNLSALYLAQGNYMLGFGGMPIAWAVTFIVYCLGNLLFNNYIAVGILLGTSFTVGIFVQMLFYVFFLEDKELLKFNFGKQGNDLLIKSLRLWALSLIGTLNERLTPFLLEIIAPAFLPFFLIISQVLQGLSGILSQINRIMLRNQVHVLATQNINKEDLSFNAIRLLNFLIQEGVLLFSIGMIIYVQFFVSYADKSYLIRLGLLVIFSWLVSALGSVVTAPLLAFRHDRYFLILMFYVSIVSFVFQVIGCLITSPDFILWSKVLLLMVILIKSYDKIKFKPGIILILTSTALTACWAFYTFSNFTSNQIPVLLFFICLLIVTDRHQLKIFLAERALL